MERYMKLFKIQEKNLIGLGEFLGIDIINWLNKEIISLEYKRTKEFLSKNLKIKL